MSHFEGEANTTSIFNFHEIRILMNSHSHFRQFILFSIAAIAFAQIFSGCAAAGLFTAGETAALTSFGVRTVATRAIAGTAARAAVARTSLIVADEAFFGTQAARMTLTRQGSKTFLKSAATGANVIEILSKRSFRTVESGQIINLPGDVYLVNTKGLNVRSGPGTNHPVVAQLTKERPVSVISRKDGWVEAWITDEIKGWVAEKFLDALLDAAIDREYTPQQPFNSSQLNQMNQANLLDADKDGIPDTYDDCPNVSGKRELHGCPDKDADGIPDKDDRCPDVSGIYRFHGCPDSDNDGVADYEDRCPNINGNYSNYGCPIRTQIVDSDNDGVPDEIDYCPNEYGRTYSGCPYIREDGDDYAASLIDPVRRKPVQMGIGISGGFVSSALKNTDSDIENIGGLGFSPFIFTSFHLGEKSRLQLDLSYSMRSFVFSNQGDDSEYGFGDVYTYNTTNAQMSFSDVRATAKININSLYFGGYFGKVVKAKRKGNLEYYSSFDSVYDENYDYDFFDESEYPLVNGQRPVNNYVYGLTVGYEKLLRSGLLVGVGLEYQLSNYFNANYGDGWLEYGDNIDLYPSSDIDLKLHYLFVNLGYRF